MSAPRAGLLLLGLWACRTPSTNYSSGIASELNQTTFACDRLDGDARSWCALTAAQSDVGTGVEIYELCRRMEEPLSRDRCLAIAVARDTSPAPPEVCGFATIRRWREWCWTSAAVREAQQDIHGAAAACAQAGALRSQCAASVMNVRIQRLVSGESVNLREEIEALTEGEPSMAYDPGFGAAVGRAGRELGLLDRRAWPCDVLPEGSGRLSCEAAFLGDPLR